MPDLDGGSHAGRAPRRARGPKGYDAIWSRQHCVFVWLSYPFLPDKNLIVIPREDDLMFGLLQNRFHLAWALRKGGDLQERPRYTHTTTFATFPFPKGMAPGADLEQARARPSAGAIEAAARQLNELREAQLNPPDLVERVPEGVPGYPDRIVRVSPKAAATLRPL